MKEKRDKRKTGLFFPFLIDIVRSGVWAKLSKKAKCLYPALATFADFTTGECYPSISTLQKASGISRPRVLEAIDELVKAKLIIRRRGDRAHSNSYTLLGWGQGSQSAPGNGSQPPWLHLETTPGNASQPEVVAEGDRNYNQTTISNITISNNHNRGRRRSGGKYLRKEIEEELGQNRAAKRQLSGLFEQYEPEMVIEAYEEAVAQGHATIKYLRGILRNWKSSGRVERSSKKESVKRERDLRQTGERERRSKAREEVELREGRRREAEKHLSKCSSEERGRWLREALAQAEDTRVPHDLVESFIQSILLQRTAEKFNLGEL